MNKEDSKTHLAERILPELIARCRSNIKSDMEQFDLIKSSLMDHTDRAIRISWMFAHLHSSFTDFYRDLERLEKELQG